MKRGSAWGAAACALAAALVVLLALLLSPARGQAQACARVLSWVANGVLTPERVHAAADRVRLEFRHEGHTDALNCRFDAGRPLRLASIVHHGAELPALTTALINTLLPRLPMAASFGLRSGLWADARSRWVGTQVFELITRTALYATVALSLLAMGLGRGNGHAALAMYAGVALMVVATAAGMLAALVLAAGLVAMAPRLGGFELGFADRAVLAGALAAAAGLTLIPAVIPLAIAVPPLPAALVIWPDQALAWTLLVFAVAASRGAWRVLIAFALLLLAGACAAAGGGTGVVALLVKGLVLAVLLTRRGGRLMVVLAAALIAVGESLWSAFMVPGFSDAMGLTLLSGFALIVATVSSPGPKTAA